MFTCIAKLSMLFCCQIWLATAGSYVPDEIPSPLEYPQLCGANPKGVRRLGSAICDMDGILSAYDKEILEGHINRLHSVEDGTKERVEIGVCIIEEMNRHFVSGAGSVERAGEKFATILHDKWGVGNVGSHNGVLVFLSVHDRDVFISHGGGLESKLTPSAIDQIIGNMKPHLRKGDYGKALQGSVVEIGLILTGQTFPTRGRSDATNHGNEDNIGDIFTVCVIFAVILGIITLVRRAHGDDGESINDLQRGRNKLEKLMREVSAASSSDADSNAAESPHFPSTSCPICLEDFPVSSTSGNPVESSSQTSAADSFNSGADARRAMELRCGHQFCFTCLEKYLKEPHGTKCPICRAPVDPSDPAPPSTQYRGGRARRHQNRGTNSDDDEETSCTGGSILRSHQPEIRYRLQRMHTLYPRVVTADTLQTLEAAVGSGQRASTIVQQLNDRAAAVTQIISNRRIQAEMARSGAGGSTIGRSRSRVGGSSGFGGGSSSGGRGGRW